MHHASEAIVMQCVNFQEFKTIDSENEVWHHMICRHR